jgi:hypothetical protein
VFSYFSLFNYFLFQLFSGLLQQVGNLDG